MYSANFSPNPDNALDVLAFLLCPIRAFAPNGDDAELEAAERMIAPAKAEAVRRWHAGHLARHSN